MACPPISPARSRRGWARAPLDSLVEQRLLRGLLTLLALSGAVVAAMYGQAWLPAIVACCRLVADAMHWLLAVAACVGCRGRSTSCAGSRAAIRRTHAAA